MTTRTLRVHQNGRTLLAWWCSNDDWPTFPVTSDPRTHFQVRFHDVGLCDVMLDGALIYRFVEKDGAPGPNGFHRVEFLFDNDVWVLEYRRDPGTG